MAVTTLLPTGSGTQNQWSLAGLGRPDVVSLNDDGTGYIFSPRNTAQTDRLTMSNLSSGASVVSNVDCVTRHRHTGAGTGTSVRGGTYINPDYSYAAANLSVLTTWTTHTDNIATAPGGGAWTPALVNSSEIVIDHNGSGSSGNQVDCTYCALTVTYTVFGIFFFSIILPASLLVYPFLSDFQGHAQAWLEAHPQHSVSDKEIRELYQSHVDNRFPAYFDLA